MLKSRKKYMKNWRKNNPEKVKRIAKKEREKNKEYRKEYQKEYYQKNKDKMLKQYNKYHKEYYQKNKEKFKELNKRWRENNLFRAKIIDIRKMNKRKRELGFNIIVKNNLDEPFVYHHINNNDVLPFPKDIHILYSGSNRKKHRDLCLNVVNQLYPNIGILKK